MNVRDRLFERWLNAGDDRTFEEWRAARREQGIQQREQRRLASLLTPQQQRFALGIVQDHAARIQRQELYPKYAPGGLGIVGGLLRGVLG